MSGRPRGPVGPSPSPRKNPGSQIVARIPDFRPGAVVRVRSESRQKRVKEELRALYERLSPGNRLLLLGGIQDGGWSRTHKVRTLVGRITEEQPRTVWYVQLETKDEHGFHFHFPVYLLEQANLEKNSLTNSGTGEETPSENL